MRVGYEPATSGPVSVPTVPIPGGEVVLDGREERVAPFRIDRHLVTVRAFNAFLEATSGRAHAVGDPEQPVTNVAAAAAAAYAQWVGGRLPTEAEWQLAAAGYGGGRDYPWGHAFQDARGPTSFALPFEQRRPNRVGARAPLGDSLFGVSDLGEVWELTATPMSAGPVVRGGAWRDRLIPPRLDNRSTSDAAHDVGFRCAYRASPTDPGRLRPASGQGGALAWQLRHAIRPRSPDERQFRFENFGTEDGVRAYVEQQLAQLELAFEATRRDDGILDDGFPHEVLFGPGTMLERAAALHQIGPHRAPRSRRVAYVWGDAEEHYACYVEGRWFVIAHSTRTSDVSTQIFLGETCTRVPLAVFAKLEFDASDFIRLATERFEPIVDSLT